MAEQGWAPEQYEGETTATRRPGQIAEWTERVMGASAKLAKELATLEERLSPVVSQPTPHVADETPKDVEMLVPFAAMLRTIASDIDHSRDRVRSLIDRCEV